MNGMDAAGAQLDWFGVAVKAAEIPVWTARMKMLARKVRPCLAALLSSTLNRRLETCVQSCSIRPPVQGLFRELKGLRHLWALQSSHRCGEPGFHE